ncbi:uncharacterized protein MKK02DRAFT_29323 [Dioszegia hungarica]|uniref:Uncharacterized protein n=1 Tax=Dioszegia hungarica TaxID=4972 RepID=A0AA38HFK4_9TREE|nr:uncharacterized protein MKK02DRAFT_29323 [Dioszegia hungarica]KAI9639217.1 hypothetical protein MKK02DRAFT_29323 [Dioszegia hungarica]
MFGSRQSADYIQPISQTSSSQKPTLFLNGDVLRNIADHAELPSALSFVRACRSSEAAARPRIWRDVDLTLPFLPLGQYNLSTPQAEREPSADAEETRRKYRAILDKAAAGLLVVRWGQGGGSQGIATGGGGECPIDRGFIPSPIGSLPPPLRRPLHSFAATRIDSSLSSFSDIILAGPGLPTFANLTVLVLTTLDLTIKLPPMYSGAAPPSPERLAKETNLRRLRLIIEEARERLSFGQTLVEPSYNPLVDPLETVISLLRPSPHLSHLSLGYIEDNALHWRNRADADTIDVAPSIGGLNFQINHYGFASWLRLHPRISRIYYIVGIPYKDNLQVFDTLDAVLPMTTPTIKIRSYCHGGEDCFQITVLVKTVPPPSRPFGQAVNSPSRPNATTPVDILYTAGCPTARDVSPLVTHERTFYALPTDPLEADSAVPPDVLEKMREVEGASKEEWDKRGVEVGDEAWEVLMASRRA